MSDKAYVAALPPCNMHPSRDAAVDGRTVFGGWANMCEACFKSMGVGLGTGSGQRLVVGEKPPPTKRVQEMSVDELEDLVGDGDLLDFL